MAVRHASARSGLLTGTPVVIAGGCRSKAIHALAQSARLAWRLTRYVAEYLYHMRGNALISQGFCCQQQEKGDSCTNCTCWCLAVQVIPIYSRGRDFDPRQEAIKEQPVPPRPAGQRPSAVQAGAAGGNQQGVLPALFGFQLGPGGSLHARSAGQSIMSNFERSHCKSPHSLAPLSVRQQ